MNQINFDALKCPTIRTKARKYFKPKEEMKELLTSFSARSRRFNWKKLKELLWRRDEAYCSNWHHLSSDRSPYTCISSIAPFLLQIMHHLTLYIRGIVVVGIYIYIYIYATNNY
jgi:hypothetical protein